MEQNMKWTRTDKMNFFWLQGLGVNTSLLINTSLNGTALNHFGLDCVPQSCTELKIADWCTGMHWVWAGNAFLVFWNMWCTSHLFGADKWINICWLLAFPAHVSILKIKASGHEDKIWGEIKIIGCGLNSKQSISFNPAMTSKFLQHLTRSATRI